MAGGPRKENDAYAGFMRRALRAYAKRVGAGDIAALGELARYRDEVDAAITEAVRALRAEPYCHSWGRIGKELGVPRSSASDRYSEVGGARKVGGQPTHLR